jgi:protease-4
VLVDLIRGDFMARRLIQMIVLVAALAIVASIVSVVVQRRIQSRIPERTILEADFTGGLVEYVPEEPLAKAVLQQRRSVRDVVEALQRGAEDERVVALVARVGTGFGLPGKVQELRDAVLHFRSRGKRAVAFVETFGFGYAGTTNYYLATAFDEIHVLPIGDVTLAGLSLEVPFVRGALDKLGIEPQFDGRWEYKTAKDSLTNTQLTAPGREAYARVIESQFETIAFDVASARGLTLERVNEIAARGTLQSQEALEAGLIDGVSYRDEVLARVHELAPSGAERLYLGSYLARSDGPDRDAPVIALVYGVGGVSQGKSRYDPIRGGVNMGSDSVSAALRAAADDEDVRAIVFRIDSGGGSAVASQIIWRETLRAKQKGKPVVASLSDVAGSGGYFIAMGADKIVAQPGTITGSIGVFGGKLITKDFWDKLGISFDEVQTHANASMWNSIRAFTPEQSEQFELWLDRVYEIFTEGVAEGRQLPIEKVREIARGRIWTGSDALELGLVDELGGFPAAIRLAKQAAGIPLERPIELRLFPRPKHTVELLVELLTGQGTPSNSDAAVGVLVADALRHLQPFGAAATGIGLVAGRGVLEMQLPIALQQP